MTETDLQTQKKHRRQAEPTNYHTHVGRTARQYAPIASGQGAISRRYPVVLSRRSRGSGLASSTEAESADKASGSKRVNNRRQAEQNTATRLSGEQPDDRRKLQQPRRVIATLSGSFASETRGECTHVLDPRGKRSKAPGSKRERAALLTFQGAGGRDTCRF